MKYFISHHYKPILEHHGLSGFEDFWGLPGNWVEEPNDRRGGWSGVSLHKVFGRNGDSLSIFVKRQENHNYFSLRHPFGTRPTFFRDFSSMRLLKRIGVPTVEPVYYGERLTNANLQATLVTVALDGYRELNPLFRDSRLAHPLRHEILRRVADALRLMHRHRLQHGSLNGNHVMVRVGEDGPPDIRVLDLEHMKRGWWATRTAAFDLERLIRYTPALTGADHAEMVEHYARDLSRSERRRLVSMINRRLIKKCSARGYMAPTIDCIA